MNLTQALTFLKTTLENIAIASVKAIQSNIFKVDIGPKEFKVTNFPKQESITGEVTVKNQKDLEKVVKEYLTNVSNTLNQVHAAVKDLPKPVSEVSVKNQPQAMRVNNFDELSAFLEEINETLKTLPKTFPKTEIPPFPKIPAYPKFPEFPKIVIPQPLKAVGVNNLEDLVKLLRSTKAKDYIPVRLPDGDKFYKALEEAITTVSSGGRYAFSDSSGKKTQALLDEDRHIQVDVVSQPPIEFPAYPEFPEFPEFPEYPVQDPLQKYRVHDIDDTDTTKYYGFVALDGKWYIMSEDSTTKTYRYIAGDEDYPDNWDDRATLTYDYINNIF